MEGDEPAAAAPTAEVPARPPPADRELVPRARTLRDRIVEHLKVAGADSISGIARTLTRDGEAPVHRLTIAGYLQALTEAGQLRELERPPSKLYQLSSPETHWSLHQRIHRALEDQPRSEEEQVRLALAALQRLLHRPVFQAELLHAGFTRMPQGVPRIVVGDSLRRQYRDLFDRRASPRIDVPPRDALFALADDDPLLASHPVEDLIERVLLRTTASEHLAVERGAGPQQAQLDFGAPSRPPREAP